MTNDNEREALSTLRNALKEEHNLTGVQALGLCASNLTPYDIFASLIELDNKMIAEKASTEVFACESGGQTTIKPLKKPLHVAFEHDAMGYGRYVNESIAEPVRSFKLIANKSCK